MKKDVSNSVENLLPLPWNAPEASENASKLQLQREEAKITSWENLQKAKDEAAIRKLEVADISEAVRQYADALMFSRESAIGPYEQKALSVLNTTSSRMELWSREDKSKQPRTGCHICVHKTWSDGILNTCNSPNPPIFVFTSDSSTRMAFNLQWGSPFVIGLFYSHKQVDKELDNRYRERLKCPLLTHHIMTNSFPFCKFLTCFLIKNFLPALLQTRFSNSLNNSFQICNYYTRFLTAKFKVQTRGSCSSKSVTAMKQMHVRVGKQSVSMQRYI